MNFLKYCGMKSRQLMAFEQSSIWHLWTFLHIEAHFWAY